MVTLKDFFQRHRQMSEINKKSFFVLSEDFIVFTFIVSSDFLFLPVRGKNRNFTERAVV